MYQEKKNMVIVEHFPLSRWQSNDYEYGTRQMASFDDVISCAQLKQMLGSVWEPGAPDGK